jgi:hypothetical protein
MHHEFLLALGLFLVGGVILWATVIARRRRWGTVFGWVIISDASASYVEGGAESTPTYNVTVQLRYKYSISGVDYERTTTMRSDLPALGNTGRSAHELAQMNFPAYAPGDRLVVRIDPQNPAKSMLEEELEFARLPRSWWYRGGTLNR